MTQVVHCKRERFDVYIGRPSVWGNPYVIGRDGSRAEVLRKYTAWIKRQNDLLKRLRELRGKVLGCWCKPETCHGDVLAALADGLRDDDPDFRRASHAMVCEECGDEYGDHSYSYAYLSFDGHPFLTLLCSGRLVKL